MIDLNDNQAFCYDLLAEEKKEYKAVLSDRIRSFANYNGRIICLFKITD